MFKRFNSNLVFAMSVSEKRYGVFEEEDLDFTYEEEVLANLENEDYPVSASDIKRQIELSAEYADNGLEPEEVEVRDLGKVDDIIEDLRERNRSAELEGDFRAYIDPENREELYTIT